MDRLDYDEPFHGPQYQLHMYTHTSPLIIVENYNNRIYDIDEKYVLTVIYNIYKKPQNYCADSISHT